MRSGTMRTRRNTQELIGGLGEASGVLGGLGV